MMMKWLPLSGKTEWALAWVAKGRNRVRVSWTDIMDDCSEQGGERYNIYYDNETKRSPIFERNLLKDGFHLKQWID